MSTNLVLKLQVLIFSFFLIACDSDNEKKSDSSTENEINLSEAKLSDFQFNEIEYLDIKIKQPIIDNNQEMEEGEIIMTLPTTTSPLVFSLKSTNIDDNKFSVSPSVGAQELFSESKFVKYTVSSKNDPNIKISYNVKVIISPPTNKELLSISNFELLSNDKSAFTDIDLVKEAKSIQSVDSLLICLFPKKIDFADLTPAIKFNGANIEYRVNNDDFKAYAVETGENIDFKFPNTVDFKISNSTKSESIIYRIVVDSQHPISFKEQEIVIPNLKVGETAKQLGITTWSNDGNYPISTMSPNEYNDVKTPSEGLKNIFTVALSKNGGGNINPNQEGLVNIVTSNTFLSGQYESTSIFNLNFNENSWEVNNSPEDDFVTDIGYKKVFLKIKATVVD